MYVCIYIYIYTYIKTNGSESRPRKVELTHAFKKCDYHEDIYT